MKIVDFIREDLILPDIRAVKKADVLRELSAWLAGGYQGLDAAEVERVLAERERLGSTAIGPGIAIPHGKLESVHELVGCLARSRNGVDFGAEDGQPTHFFVVLIAPAQSTGDHLKALARISRVFKDSDFRKRMMKAGTAREMYRVTEQQDAH